MPRGKPFSMVNLPVSAFVGFLTLLPSLRISDGSSAVRACKMERKVYSSVAVSRADDISDACLPTALRLKSLSHVDLRRVNWSGAAYGMNRK